MKIQYSGVLIYLDDNDRPNIHVDSISINPNLLSYMTKEPGRIADDSLRAALDGLKKMYS